MIPAGAIVSSALGHAGWFFGSGHHGSADSFSGGDQPPVAVADNYATADTGTLAVDSRHGPLANDKGGLCNIYDAKSFSPTGTVNFNDDADNVRYDSSTHRIYVGYGNGGIGIIDATNGKSVGSIKLSGHPEAFILEKQGRRIFVNVPTARHVVVIDRDKGEQVAAWRTDGAFANFPIALDEANHRLFIGCRRPAKMVVLNTDTGSVVTSIAISGDTDDIFYDAAWHRLYAICGDGNVEVIEQIDPGKYKVAATIPTAPGARTGFFVSELDSLFVAIPRRGSQVAEVRRFAIE